MGSTTFAVVVTCYNYREFVVEAIDSALAQTRAPAQLIAVDDGSSDGSADLLRARYGSDPRVTLICAVNGGQLVAFQRGLACVEADVVCFLDADDRWSADYLQHIGEWFDRQGDLDFVFSDVRLFGKEQGAVSYAERTIDLGYTAISTYLDAHWYGAPTSALALRTACARRALDLPNDALSTWRLSADNCLVYGASILGARKLFTPTGCVHYRVHGNNGWWGRQSAQAKFLNRYRSRCLIEQYARRVGLTDACIEDIKYEYRSKPQPSWREARRYARLALRGRISTLHNLGRALSILLSRVFAARRRSDPLTAPKQP
jgi:glycosyltransferase involved in cell wall biosynthesis